MRRRAHKERSQPSKRRKYGLLEKHKDYILRANDFKRKKRAIQSLSEKAEFRNKDEFYFAMTNAKTVNGRHIAEGHETIGADALKLMRTQDVAYVRRQLALETSKTEKLRSNLHFIEASAALTSDEGKPRHTIFLDDVKSVNNFSAADHFNTLPEFVGRTYNRPTVDDLRSKVVVGPSGKKIKKLKKQRELAYRELRERTKRQKELEGVVEHMEVQRNLERKGRRLKVKDGEDGKPAVYRWRKKRKR